MITLQEVTTIGSRAAKLSVDYIVEVLHLPPLAELNLEQADAYLSVLVSTMIFLEIYLKLQLPVELQEKVRDVIGRQSQALVNQIAAASGPTPTPKGGSDAIGKRHLSA